ncbi:hypothetical protein HY621_01050 [Candidatus Uhrbacteria bacterium]|nr:hypothetical protein [Candidatus Uhrbacteria bacterium]
MKNSIRLALVIFCFSLLPLQPLHAADTIQWQKPKKITTLDIFESADADYTWIKEESAFYHVGDISNGNYAGGQLIIVYVTTGPFMENVYHLIKKGTAFTLLKKYSADPANEDYPFSSKKVRIDASYTISALEFPKVLKGPKARQILTEGKGNGRPFSLEGLKKVFTHNTYGDVYAATDGFFFIKSPSGEAIAYKADPDFSITSIRWNAGQKKITKENEYTYKEEGGCHMSALSVASLTPNRKELKQVGTNAKGDLIYFLKDSSDDYLRNMHETYAIDDAQFGSLEKQRDKKISYKKFLSIRPAFFWIDPFGRLITYKNTNLVTFAECGKPVIYLYPEKAQDVSVSLAPQGGFTKTEPAYENGWFVHAQPDGTLTDYRTGTQYPYLFWEGRGSSQSRPVQQQGFVVARNDVHSFLENTLARLGLNSKERGDFEEFWEPRMEDAAYYKVQFFGNRLMDEIAPLVVSPRPDTIIRILMDYTPLAHPIQIEPQTLVAPARDGFTLVEWGGVLR